MNLVTPRLFSGALAAGCAVAALTVTTARGAAAPSACDPDNGGLWRVIYTGK